jgi:hypothetical protein
MTKTNPSYCIECKTPQLYCITKYDRDNKPIEVYECFNPSCSHKWVQKKRCLGCGDLHVMDDKKTCVVCSNIIHYRCNGPGQTCVHCRSPVCKQCKRQTPYLEECVKYICSNCLSETQEYSKCHAITREGTVCQIPTQGVKPLCHVHRYYKGPRKGHISKWLHTTPRDFPQIW